MVLMELISAKLTLLKEVRYQLLRRKKRKRRTRKKMNLKKRKRRMRKKMKRRRKIRVQWKLYDLWGI